MLVERRQSEIHGSGVFSREFILKDNWAYIYGEVIPLQPHPMEHYCMEHDHGQWLPYAPWCWLNHSEDPNCEFAWDEDEEIYCLIALRLIEPDEELTIDYGYQP